MEDQNYSKSKEAKSLNLRRAERFKKECDGLKSVMLNHFSIDLTINDKSFELSANEHTISTKGDELNCATNWVSPIFRDHKNLTDKNLNYLESSRRTYGQFRKKLNMHLKNLNKSPQKNHQKILSQYFEDSQYRELYNVIHNFQSLPNFLLSLEVFSTYSNCQIFAHERGQAFALTSFSSNRSKSQSYKVKTEDFNKIFQSIKKSKSKIFFQQSFSDAPIEAIGTFLAKSFTGSQYNLILILGRNDFLPPSEDEIDHFNEITDQLDPVFNAILRRSAQDDKISNIIEVLESLPYPISITDKSEFCLFKNEAFEALASSENKEQSCLEKELFGKNILRFYLNKESKEQTDLYHFYRVSLLGELLNTLRHELSNPLFGLSLAGDMLLDEQMDEEIYQTITDIKTNCERCQTIIKNFSNLYQDEEDFKSFDLIELLKETIILTKSETKGIKKNIRSDLEKIPLYSNPTWISQIVFNIIINSGQALYEACQQNLRDTEIVLTVEKGEDSIFISVSDNGPGVPESEVDKLFDPFFTTKEFGTGLGLSICKNLVTKLEGEIFYQNKETGGAKFTISLPHELL